MMEKKTSTSEIDDVLRWHFFNLYCMALSDEEFDFSERQVLHQIGVEHGISPEQINEVICTTNIKPAIPEKIEDKVACLYDLVRMAWADGKIEPEERSTIKKCVVRYGFLAENADGIVDYFINSVKNKKTKEEMVNEING